jgi:two-component system chemotaxis sensor kinase CheA
MEEEIYAFPLSEVFETIRIKKEQINTLEGHEIINLRGEVLPIYRLDRIIGLSERPGREESPVVIVNYNSRKLGFIVDELIGKHETVIKTLEKNYKNIKGLTGASIMGDGTIILVLDIGGLIDITGNIVRDQSGLTGEEMLRLNESYVTDINSSATIYKTKNATNIFNQSLLQLKQQDKSRKKKEKSDRKKVVIQKDYSTEEIAKQEEEIQTEKEPVVQEIQSEVQKENPYIVKEDTQAQDDILNDELEEAIPVDITEEMDEREKAKEMLKSFSEQTKKRVEDLITTDRPINEIMSKEEIRKLESVVNTGMMNAGLVLSQLVGSNVELFMPEITLMDADELSNQIRDSNENFFGMKVRMNGDLNGNLLMVFSEAKGRELADKLLKSNESSDLAKKISEDSLSVLMEISNIVCASVMNSLSNKAKAQIMPSVPELITGTFKQVIEFVKPERTKFLTMNTEFIYEGDNLIGNLIFLPDFDELVKLISKLS